MLLVFGQQVGDQDFGRRSHDPVRAVVLRHPIAVVDPAVGPRRQLDGVLESLGGGLVSVHRTLVQDAKCQPVGELVSVAHGPEVGL